MAMRERRARRSAGRRLGDRLQSRAAPASESMPISTFNLRWQQHVEHERETIPSPGDTRARETRIGSTV
jgi:hypothetical protein